MLLPDAAVFGGDEDRVVIAQDDIADEEHERGDLLLLMLVQVIRVVGSGEAERRVRSRRQQRLELGVVRAAIGDERSACGGHAEGQGQTRHPASHRRQYPVAASGFQHKPSGCQAPWRFRGQGDFTIPLNLFADFVAAGAERFLVPLGARTARRNCSGKAYAPRRSSDLTLSKSARKRRVGRFPAVFI
ncbi:hypothetical protein [Methyloceanibacter superfactus]|uniref:hypothetical protein n=1 Tax=Methyloceanibacter superfactus TaxID=1774969 RepID=UPI003139FCB7